MKEHLRCTKGYLWCVPPVFLRKINTDILRQIQRYSRISLNMTIIDSMNQSNQSTNTNRTNSRRPRKCSSCGRTGHDKRKCPSRAPNNEVSTPGASEQRNRPTQQPLQVDFTSCVYCVFDLETTGFSRNYHDIIEICAILADSNGVVHDREVATFHSLVKPPAPISPLITGITGISDETVADAPSFQECGADFIKFLRDNCKKTSGIGDIDWDADSSADDSGEEADDDQSSSLRDIVLVAQNGNRFDVPFLFKSMQTYRVDIKGSHSKER
jgi:DNA polymerase III, alpha subunit (gram-positive type)